MTWIQTYRGKQFWPLKPKTEDVHILDIAQGLSQEIRFTGQCSPAMTVAQHSVLVSHLVPPEHALWGLLHDAGEAYLWDICRPIKPHIWIEIDGRMHRASDVEDRILHCVAERFGLPWPMPPAVKDMDTRLVVREAKVVMKPPPAPWDIDAEPAEIEFTPQTMEHAKLSFLERFVELTEAGIYSPQPALEGCR